MDTNKDLLLSSLKKLNSAQLTREERHVVVKELRKSGFKVKEVAEATGMSKGNVSHVCNGVRNEKHFNFYNWLQEGIDNIDGKYIILTMSQQRDLDIILLRLNKIRGGLK